ncbi:MAG: DUF488 domain-containing protein [Bacteroidetes bacterium]|nr:DUF488 domain-containing protein [Bacteroidota bacterium]
MNIHTKRVYDPPATEDGTRVLVDRVWPRGMTKEHAHADVWLKDAAPSTPLRTWFNHDPDKWKEFKRRYAVELDDNGDVVEHLLALAAHGRVTLLYSARDTEHNQAVALREYLLRHGRNKRS